MSDDRTQHDEASSPGYGDRPARPGDTLPRSAILRGRDTFASVFEQGQSTRSGRLIVKFLVAPSSERSVVAGFVLRRGSGNAVRRNRVKRLLREAYRLERRAFEERLSSDVALRLVILWNGTRDDAPHETLDRVRTDLAAALRKIAHRIRTSRDES